MKSDSAPQLLSKLNWSSAIIRRYHDRQNIFLEGDKKAWIYRVEAGTVCLYKMLANGRQQIFGFPIRNEIIGLEAGDEYQLSALSMGITRLRCLPVTLLDREARTDADFALHLYEAISSELEATRELLITLGQHGSTERMAVFLLNLAGRNRGGKTQLLNLPMTRFDIADFLGMTIETVSRALARLGEMKLIVVRGRSKIQVKDIDGLQQLAGLPEQHIEAVGTPDRTS